MKFIHLLSICSILFFATACQNNSTSETTDAEQILPHGGDLPEKELTAEDKAKLLNAKGKDVKTITYDELADWMNQDDDVVYVFNFWATWCKPCIEEMPYFEKLADEFEDKKVKVIFVSMDHIKLLDKGVIPFVREKQIRSEVVLLHDDNRTQDEIIGLIEESWDGALPATIFIQNSSDTRIFYQRSFDYDELNAAVFPLTI